MADAVKTEKKPAAKKAVVEAAAPAPAVATATEDTVVEKATEKPLESKIGLDDAILAVMEACPYVQKTGKAGSGKWGYTFASEVDLIAALHPLMVQHKLTLVPTNAKVVYHELYPSVGEGKMMSRVVVRMTYRLTHAASKESRKIVTLGEGTDLGDKATPKAMTIALKYAMRQCFNVETGNDPDEKPGVESARTVQATGGVSPATAAPADDPTTGDMGDSFKRCRAAIQNAATMAALEELKRVYSHKEGRRWNYRASQIAALEAAYAAREKDLKSAATE